MLSRINVYRIIKDHFGTLRSLNQKSKRMYWKDFILFVIFPNVLAIGLAYKDVSLDKYVGNLIAAISIFGGFLFNLLAIIYSQLEKIKLDTKSTKDEDNRKLKLKFVNEIHINISFNIVLSLFIVLTLIACTIEIPQIAFRKFLKELILYFNYFLLILFFLTILMVVNRIYILLKKDTSESV